jgi:alginate O-acetyltransferase complex protein AlgI
MDYHIGRELGQTENPHSRKRLLVISLVANIGILGFFKYTNFVLESFWFGLITLGLDFGRPHYDIILPPAISYFTFASMSYIIDVYYERFSPCGSVLEYSVFVTFFPKLLAGPIVRAVNFLPQLEQQVRASAADIETGLVYFLIGAVKKLVISDQIAGNVNMIFSTPSQYDGFSLFQGLLGYAVQIYCDFSGYSDMAIGCALILGYRFPENFQMPYSAITITEFWRRWHITLSTWFRDYVFLPREMATRDYRNATLRSVVNMMLTMLLCGLWHGANWNFVIWGGIHGLALSIHKVWTDWNPLVLLERDTTFQFAWRCVSRLLTLAVVLLGWVFFRTESLGDAGIYLGRMLSWSHDGTRLVSPNIFPVVAAVFVTHLFINKDCNWVQEITQKSVAARIGAYTCLLLLLVSLGATNAAPFIYFQF